MRGLDSFLLDQVYIPLSRVAGRQWGATAGSLSRACLPPMLVFGSLRIAVIRAELPALEMFLLIALVAIFWRLSLRADGTPNPFEIEPPIMRLFWLFLMVFVVIDFDILLGNVAHLLERIACVSAVYFRAVPNPPPMKRRDAKEPLEAQEAGAV